MSEIKRQNELEDAGAALAYYREQQALSSERLYAAIVDYCTNGGTESAAARIANVDRMTVRRALGKR